MTNALNDTAGWLEQVREEARLKAIAEERERCARIAGSFPGVRAGSFMAFRQRIADEIRKEPRP